MTHLPVSPDYLFTVIVISAGVMLGNFVFWLFEYLSEKRVIHLLLAIVYILLYVCLLDVAASLQPPPLKPIPTLEVLRYERPQEPKW